MKLIKKDGKGMEDIWMKKDEKVGFCKKDRKRTYIINLARFIIFAFSCTYTSRRTEKNCIEEIMKEENDWDYISEADMVEGPIEKVTQEKMVIAIAVI